MTDVLAATTLSTATDALPGSANTVDAHIATPLTDAVDIVVAASTSVMRS